MCLGDGGGGGQDGEWHIFPLSFGRVTFISWHRLLSIGNSNNGALRDP